MSLMVEINQDGSNSPLQAKGPAVLLPHEAIGNVVTKTNTLILEHRDWLDNLPQRKERLKREEISTTAPPPSLITPAPSLEARYRARQLGVLPECSPVSSSLASQLSSVSSTCSIRIASLQAALVNAESAFSSAQASAAVALSSASVSARAIISVSVSVSSSASSAIAGAQASASSSVSSAISSAQSSASLAIAAAISSAQSSANLAIGLAQSSASVSVKSANDALTSVQISASSAIASASSVALSANSLAGQARATASLAIQSAQASVSAAQQSASATRVAAMNETILALTITFSIIGSSLISILIYYLISRYRRRRRERKQSELKERIHRVRHESDDSLGPSLSAFPMPVGRSKWMSRNGSRPNTVETAEMTGGTGGMLTGSATLLNPLSQPGSAPLQGGLRDGERRTWAPNGSREVQGRGGGMSQGDMDFAFGTGGSGQLSGGRDGRKTWAARETIPEERVRRTPPPLMVRKNTLTYDPEHPDRPPKFTTWLEESFRSVSPFPDMEVEQKGKAKGRMSLMGLRNSLQPKRQSLMQRRRSRSMGEISDIGTAI